MMSLSAAIEKVTAALLLILSSWEVKPTELITSTAFPDGAVMEKDPSALVTVVTPVPFTCTVTLSSGLPDAFVILPVTGKVVCAKDNNEEMVKSNAKNTFFNKGTVLLIFVRITLASLKAGQFFKLLPCAGASPAPTGSFQPLL